MTNEIILPNKLLENIRSILNESRVKLTKTLNQTMINTYWLIGKEIIEEEQKGRDRAEYGQSIIKNLSKQLTTEYGKGFSVTNLKYIRQFYLTYQIGHSLSGELSWTHYRLLLKIDKPEKRSFYELECINNNWSTRELERQINSLLFERLTLSKNKDAVMAMAKEGQVINTPEDLIKDPIVLEFLGLKQSDDLYEKDLESSLIQHLQKFLLELGKGFSFVARQKRITLGEDHFYIDLVFYNYLARCFVLIDLKIGKLTHQDLGQIQMYVNYYTRELMNKDDNPPIGIVLCADKNEAVVKYTLTEDNSQIFASRYKLYLPTEEELKAELLKEKAIIELNQPEEEIITK